MKTISTTTGIIVIVAAAAMLVGGAFAWQWQVGNPKFKILNPKQIQSPNTQNPETVGWKTYSSESAGFSLDYPQGMTIASKVIDLTNPGDSSVTFINNYADGRQDSIGVYPKLCAQKILSGEISNSTSIVIDGFPAKVYFDLSMGDGIFAQEPVMNSVVYFQQTPNNKFNPFNVTSGTGGCITMSFWSDNRSTVDRIIQSFKFTK